MTEREALREEFKDKEYKYGYVEGHTDLRIALQLKLLRTKRGLTQKRLAELVGTQQPGVARVEDVNYRGWTVETLKIYARALGVNLVVKFVTDEEILDDMEAFDRELQEVQGSSSHKTPEAEMQGVRHKSFSPLDLKPVSPPPQKDKE